MATLSYIILDSLSTVFTSAEAKKLALRIGIFKRGAQICLLSALLVVYMSSKESKQILILSRSLSEHLKVFFV